MLKAAREDPPRQSLHSSWPLNFFLTRPKFDRKAENLPYIEWLKDYLCDGDEVGDEEGDGDGDEDDEEDEESDTAVSTV
jgi:hypothetical protein